jgi:hypothetical protein
MDNYFILSSKSWGQVDQSNSQHDKFQVGDMHTYHGELSHFDTFTIILTIISPMIPSIIQSSSQ